MKTADLYISPFQKLLGLELISATESGVSIRLPATEGLLRMKRSSQLHGGVLSALIDIAGSYAVEVVVGGDAPTVDLRIDYLRPAEGDLVATARVLKRGRKLCVADVEVRDLRDKLVATGRGLFANTAEGSEHGRSRRATGHFAE